MADNTTTYTTIIETQVTGGDQVQDLGEKVKNSDEKFESLRAQIRKTTVAMQALADQGKTNTKEFEDLRNELDDLNDAQEKVAFQAGQFDDQLASLPGPLGAVGQGIQSFNEGLNKFSTGFKVAFGVVGLIVSAFFALKESLSRTEEGQKKLTQITESFTKIMNGLFAIIEPIAMALADMVIKLLSSKEVMNALSKTAGVLGGVLSGLLGTLFQIGKFIVGTLINNFKALIGVAMGAGKVIKGVFTFDWDSIKAGAEQAFTAVKDAAVSQVENAKGLVKGVTKAVVDGYDAAEKGFKTGSARLTELEKKNAEEKKKAAEEAAKKAEEARKAALEAKLKDLETEDKLDEARLNKMKEIALAAAKTEEEKLKVEEAFTKKSYEMKRKDIEDKQKLYGKNTNEYKAYQAELINLDANYVKESANLRKQKEENDKKALEKLLADAQSFNDKIAQIGLDALKDETLKAEVAREQKRNKDKEALMKDAEFLKLTVEEQNGFLRQLEKGFQNDIAKIREDARVKENEKKVKALDDELRLLELTGQSLLADTKAYFENRAAVLDAAELKELAKLDITEREKLAIKEKYSKLRQQLDDDEIASYGRIASQTVDALAKVTGALAASYDEDAKKSKEAFETRKKLQKATAIMSAASGIIQILTQPSTLPSPFDWIVKGINAVALGISTAVQIKNINATQFEGGGSTPTTSVSQGASSAPAVSLPKLEQVGVPSIQGTQGGTNPTQQLADTLSARTEKPIKAYVVSGDVTSQQALDRRTTVAATFGG